MLSPQTALTGVERLAAAGLDAKSLRHELVGVVAPAVGADAHVWLLTDPVTRVGTSPYASVPVPLPQLPHLTRLRYLEPALRWDRLLAGGRSVGTLRQVTGGRLQRSAWWHEALRPWSVVDVLTATFADRFGCWGWLDLWRCAPSSPWAPEHVDLLGEIVRMVTPGLRRALAVTFEGPPEVVLEDGPAVVVLDPSLVVRHTTGAALASLARLNPPEQPVDPVPAAAYNVGAALVAHEQGLPVGPPWARVHLGGTRWVTLRAARLTASPGEQDGQIAVTLQATPPAERRDLYGRTHGLTAREREVLDLLAAGAGAADVARSLTISQHTAHDHVKAVLTKTGTGNQRVLLSRAAGR